MNKIALAFIALLSLNASYAQAFYGTDQDDKEKQEQAQEHQDKEKLHSGEGSFYGSPSKSTSPSKDAQ